MLSLLVSLSFSIGLNAFFSSVCVLILYPFVPLSLSLCVLFCMFNLSFCVCFICFFFSFCHRPNICESGSSSPLFSHSQRAYSSFVPSQILKIGEKEYYTRGEFYFKTLLKIFFFSPSTAFVDFD